MDRLNKQQLSGIARLVARIHDENTIRIILKTLGKENWTRDILSNSSSYLTEEQNNLFWSLGGDYSDEEIDIILDNDDMNSIISEKLKEQGVTHYLYENEDYLDEIREGKIICEGINIEEIKNMI